MRVKELQRKGVGRSWNWTNKTASRGILTIWERKHKDVRNYAKIQDRVIDVIQWYVAIVDVERKEWTSIEDFVPVAKVGDISVSVPENLGPVWERLTNTAAQNWKEWVHFMKMQSSVKTQRRQQLSAKDVQNWWGCPSLCTDGTVESHLWYRWKRSNWMEE